MIAVESVKKKTTCFLCPILDAEVQTVGQVPCWGVSVTQMCRWTHRAINKVATVRLPNWTSERSTGRHGLTQSPQLLTVLWLSLLKRTMKKNTRNFSTFSGLNCPQKTKIWSINETHERILFVFIQTLGKRGTQKIKRKKKGWTSLLLLVCVAFLWPLGLGF